MEKNMKLRPATKEDYEILFELFNEIQSMHFEARPDIFKPAKKDKYFYEYFDRVMQSENHHLIIGFDDDKPIGYIYYVINDLQQNIYRRQKRIIYINHILVKKRNRGKGFGRALINHVRDIGRQEKIKEIGLDVWAFNKRAIRFFNRQGFSAHNQIMWHKMPD